MKLSVFCNIYIFLFLFQLWNAAFLIAPFSWGEPTIMQILLSLGKK